MKVNLRCQTTILQPILILVFLIISYSSQATVLGLSNSAKLQADLIVFSFDRPLQLYALLESCKYYLTGIEKIFVIYRASNDRFNYAYLKVKEHFSDVDFSKQGSHPNEDFKPLFLNAFYTGHSPYIIFAVDDIIIKNYADLTICTRALEEFGAYGFYLRLAPHIDYCYSESLVQPLPPLQKVADNIMAWTFKYGTLDWHYPNTVDMTIYRKVDIAKELKNLSFRNPNTLEDAWAANGFKVMNRKGLCFNESVVVNIPINIVQKDRRNRNMQGWSPEELLGVFENGGKIDFLELKGIRNKSCHAEFEITLNKRASKD